MGNQLATSPTPQIVHSPLPGLRGRFYNVLPSRRPVAGPLPVSSPAATDSTTNPKHRSAMAGLGTGPLPIAAADAAEPATTSDPLAAGGRWQEGCHLEMRMETGYPGIRRLFMVRFELQQCIRNCDVMSRYALEQSLFHECVHQRAFLQDPLLVVNAAKDMKPQKSKNEE